MHFDAVYNGNDSANDELNCKMAEYAKAVVDGRPASFHINIVNRFRLTATATVRMTRLSFRTGMFASFDPGGADVACGRACNRMPVMPGSLLDENLRACGARDHHDHFTNVSPNTDWRSCMEHGEKKSVWAHAAMN